ncbi:MAG: sigma-70 family RNA polymerase sigma factor [Planctomycetia bacterium]|nr:sigma-70 family RNA polymerase sigma factor [Planctomycetia bacterium]
MTQTQEDRLAADLKRRKRSAWNAVYGRHVGEIFGFIFHLVGGDRSLAEDLSQNTWLASLGHIDQFDPARGTLRGWLFGIARRQVALYYRSRAAGGPRSHARGGDDDAPDVPDTSLVPDDVLEQIERADAVRAALSLLKEEHRDVLVWKYVEGLSVDQIASQAGATAKTIESRLTRARARMRELLRGYFSASGEQERKEPNDGTRSGT